MATLAGTLASSGTWGQRAKDILLLAKPRLSALVIATCGVGLWVAPSSLKPGALLLTMLGTSLFVAAANALNSYLERDVDALMHRTRRRPLPDGRLAPPVALYVSIGGAALAFATLWLSANPLTAGLGLIAYLVYVAIYTPAKKKTTAALWIGTIPGALPPLMGWTAQTGLVSPLGLSLFAVLGVWQVPHFLAVALWMKDDFARGKLRVFPLVFGARATAWAMTIGAVLLTAVSLAAPLRERSAAYGPAALALGLLFLGFCAAGLSGSRFEKTGWARSVFIASLCYLVGWCALVVAL